MVTGKRLPRTTRRSISSILCRMKLRMPRPPWLDIRRPIRRLSCARGLKLVEGGDYDRARKELTALLAAVERRQSRLGPRADRRRAAPGSGRQAGVRIPFLVSGFLAGTGSRAAFLPARMRAPSGSHGRDAIDSRSAFRIVSAIHLAFRRAALARQLLHRAQPERGRRAALPHLL